VPGVYTRVSQYIDWINGHVEDNTTPTVTPTATTPTVTPTVTTTPGPNALKNGDFEQGADGTWTESSSQFGGQGSLILHSSEVESVTPRSGEYLAWLGGADDEVSELSQQVKIPNNAKLTFYVQSYSGDVCGYDFLKLLIDDIAVASADLCESTNTSTWKKTEVDLSDLAGQTVTLTLYVSTDDAIPSNLFIDDVALTGTGGGSTPTPVTPTPVTPTATPTPPIKNGDFEQGANDEWLEQSLKLGGLGMLIVDKSKLPQGKTPFSGSYAAKMGGIAEEESTLSQSQIELNTGVEGLVYQYWIDSSGSCNTDKATVEINGVVVATHQLCQQTNTKGWKQAQVDLKPYAGETINLTFHLITDAEDDSLFLLDDVAVAYPKPDSSSLYLPMLKR
jgi:hypothetical protein